MTTNKTSLLRLLLVALLGVQAMSCSQDKDVTPISDTDNKPGVKIFVDMSTQEDDDLLKGLTFQLDNAIAFPLLAHNEESVVVHTYFRSTDPSQPMTYIPLTWERLRDENNAYTDRLHFKRQEITLAPGTDLSQGSWFVAGIISDNVDSQGMVTTNPNYSINLSELTRPSTFKLDIPFAFPWTPLQISTESTSAEPNIEKINVTFKPTGTLLRLQVNNLGQDSYDVQGFEIESDQLSMPGSISPIDPSTPAPAAGIFPPVGKISDGKISVRASANFTLSASGSSSASSPELLLWTLGGESGTTTHTTRLYMLVKQINEFGQVYIQRKLIRKSELNILAGRRYSISASAEDLKPTILSYLMEHNLSTGSIEQTALSQDPAQSGNYPFASIYSRYGREDSGVPVSPLYSTQEQSLATLGKYRSNAIFPARSMDWTAAWTSENEMESIGIPIHSSTMSSRSSYRSLGTNVLYARRFHSQSNMVGGFMLKPTAFRYAMVDNPEGSGRALQITSIETDESLDVISSEDWWQRQEIKAITKILPATGVLINGISQGVGEEVYLLLDRNSDGTYSILRAHSGGLEYRTVTDISGYEAGHRLFRTLKGIEGSGVIGD